MMEAIIRVVSRASERLSPRSERARPNINDSLDVIDVGASNSGDSVEQNHAQAIKGHSNNVQDEHMVNVYGGGVKRATQAATGGSLDGEAESREKSSKASPLDATERVMIPAIVADTNSSSPRLLKPSKAQDDADSTRSIVHPDLRAGNGDFKVNGEVSETANKDTLVRAASSTNGKQGTAAQDNISEPLRRVHNKGGSVTPFMPSVDSLVAGVEKGRIANGEDGSSPRVRRAPPRYEDNNWQDAKLTAYRPSDVVEGPSNTVRTVAKSLKKESRSLSSSTSTKKVDSSEKFLMPLSTSKAMLDSKFSKSSSKPTSSAKPANLSKQAPRSSMSKPKAPIPVPSSSSSSTKKKKNASNMNATITSDKKASIKRSSSSIVANGHSASTPHNKMMVATLVAPPTVNYGHNTSATQTALTENGPLQGDGRSPRIRRAPNKYEDHNWQDAKVQSMIGETLGSELVGTDSVEAKSDFTKVTKRPGSNATTNSKAVGSQARDAKSKTPSRSNSTSKPPATSGSTASSIEAFSLSAKKGENGEYSNSKKKSRTVKNHPVESLIVNKSPSGGKKRNVSAAVGAKSMQGGSSLSQPVPRVSDAGNSTVREGPDTRNLQEEATAMSTTAESEVVGSTTEPPSSTELDADAEIPGDLAERMMPKDPTKFIKFSEFYLTKGLARWRDKLESRKSNLKSGFRTREQAMSEFKMIRANEWVHSSGGGGGGSGGDGEDTLSSKKRIKKTLAEDEEAEPCNCPVKEACADDHCLNRGLQIECDPKICPVELSRSGACQNMRLTKNDRSKTEVRVIDNKGCGLFAAERISKGSLVHEYIGEVIDEGECNKRLDTVYVDEKHKYLMCLSGGLFIDATRRGNTARFINHSCAPNCVVQEWQVKGLSRMGIYSVRDIAEGEEITFNYNFQRFGEGDLQQCHCGAKTCRGFLGRKHIQDEDDDNDSNEGASLARKKKKMRLGQDPVIGDNIGRVMDDRLSQRAEMLVLTIRDNGMTDHDLKLVRSEGLFLVRNVNRVLDNIYGVGCTFGLADN